jgi:hypothetical protein
MSAGNWRTRPGNTYSHTLGTKLMALVNQRRKFSAEEIEDVRKTLEFWFNLLEQANDLVKVMCLNMPEING